MTFTAENIPDLTGKVAIVTGGNTGLGLETVRQLSLKNAKVYMASRTESRAKEAIEKLKQENPNAQIEFLHLDLTDVKQVHSAAEKILNSIKRLDILVNNAGIMASPFELTKDGIEAQFGTNHIGHFVFTTTLLPLIERSAPARIVNVSSIGHSFAPKGGIPFDKINNEKAMSNLQRYGVSKLSNILFTKSLAERLKEKQVYVNTLHPGGVNTELMRGPLAAMSPFVQQCLKILYSGISFLLLTPQQGALTQLYAATSNEIVEKNYRGEYFIPIAKHSQPTIKEATDSELAEKLWDYSEKIMKDILSR